MPSKDLNDATGGQEGLNFENILRDYLAAGVIAVEPDGAVTLPPEAERTFHLPAGMVASLESLPRAVQAVLLEVQSTGQAVINRRVVLQPDGKAALSLTALPMPAERKGIRVFALLRELSSSRKMESNLRRLDRLASMGTISASM